MVSDDIEGMIAWSPDGQWIAFRSLRNDEDYGVRKIRGDGNDMQTMIKSLYAAIAWSPDGTRIVIADQDIYVALEDGSHRTRLTYLPNVATSPAWSPDGQWIVFTYREDEVSQLYRIKLDGTELQRITDMKCSASHPDWIRMPGHE